MTTDGSDAPIQDKAPGVARGFASGLVLPGRIFCGKPEVHFSGKCFLYVVAFSAENRKSTFPENASFAWSHFLRKTGSPLFRKMLLCLVAFSAENRESTFPENASFAW
jgi:hypothetical protein